MLRTAVAALLLTLLGGCARLPTVDLVIEGGTVVDGTGSPSYIADIWVTGDRIVHMGATGSAVQATQRIQAEGLIVSPGFIDPHTHADEDLKDPDKSMNAAYLHQGVTTVFIGSDGGGDDVGAVAALLSHGTGTNVALLSGHGSLRKRVMGYDDRAPTTSELNEMRLLFRRDLDAGSFGLSSGLFYAPGSFALTEELVTLANEMVGVGGVYDTHIRDESDYNIGLLAAVDEALQIGREAGVPVHFAHLKALGPGQHGNSKDIVERIEKAQAEGLTVTADQYPWLASGTRFSNALLPRSLMSGGLESMHEILRNPAEMEKLRPAIEENMARRGGPDAMLITGDSEFRGLTLQEASQSTGLTPIETAVQIVLAGDPSIASFMMSKEDVQHIGQQPWVVTASDGSNGHPRKFGTFPEKYQRFVREWQLIPLETFVARSSGDTAKIFGICDRGILREGAVADIAIWHPEKFVSNADYEQPRLLASGVTHLLVNGETVIEDGAMKENRAGRILKRQSCAADD